MIYQVDRHRFTVISHQYHRVVENQNSLPVASVNIPNFQVGRNSG